jgi:YidC/Oxa1 family membrane protein insertase
MFDGLFEGMAWIMAFFFDLTHSYGVAIILLTLVVMAVVTPLTLKGTKSMMAMQRLQPEIRRLQQEHKGDRQKLNEEMLKFYRENSINPMGSCLPMLIQMPIFLVLFRVVQGLTRLDDNGTFDPRYLSETSALYRSLKGKTEMNFLGFDLEKSPLKALTGEGFISALPYIALVGLWIGSSYVQQRQISGRNADAMTPQQKMMMRIVPIFSLTAVYFPAALSVYWVTSNFCRVATQGYISHRFYGHKAMGLSRNGGTDTGDATESGPKAKTIPAKSEKVDRPKNQGAKKPGQPAAPKTSGRVTQPKNRPAAGNRSSNRPAPGRRRSGSGGSGSASGDKGGPANGARPSRRTPNTTTASLDSNGSGASDADTGKVPPKKRRR